MNIVFLTALTGGSMLIACSNGESGREQHNDGVGQGASVSAGGSGGVAGEGGNRAGADGGSQAAGEGGNGNSAAGVGGTVGAGGDAGHGPVSCVPVRAECAESPESADAECCAAVGRLFDSERSCTGELKALACVSLPSGYCQPDATVGCFERGGQDDPLEIYQTGSLYTETPELLGALTAAGFVKCSAATDELVAPLSPCEQ